MKLLFKRALVVAISPLLLTLSGCADGASPTAVEQGLTAGGLLVSRSGLSPDLNRLAEFEQQPSITIGWAKKWIGPAGGRLDFQGFAIDVPAGAVDRVTMFSIRLPVAPSGFERVVAEFGPHGSSFAIPVTIELPLAGTSVEQSSTAAIFWWDGNSWSDMGGTVTADGGRVATQTDHFSTYGTSDDGLMGGGVTASGG